MDAVPPKGQRPAPVDHPVHPLLQHRWSPRAYSGAPVPRAALLSVLEAARWAPSSFNEQPWRFICAPREEAALFEAFFDCLTPPNKRWVREAGVLMLVAGKRARDRDGQPNRYLQHDVGAALACAAVQAVDCGLQLHVMGGFEADAIAGVCGLPDGWVPVAMAALGVPGDPATLPEDLHSRETAPRRRLPLSQIASLGRVGTPLV